MLRVFPTTTATANRSAGRIPSLLDTTAETVARGSGRMMVAMLGCDGLSHKWAASGVCSWTAQGQGPGVGRATVEETTHRMCRIASLAGEQQLPPFWRDINIAFLAAQSLFTVSRTIDISTTFWPSFRATPTYHERAHYAEWYTLWTATCIRR